MGKDFGKKSLKKRLSPEQKALVDSFRPAFARAAKIAENNKRNHGVLSIPTKDPGEASDILNNSIVNSFARWETGLPTAGWQPNVTKETTPKFVDFFQKRWAPIGAENDPDNLNKNFAPNMRKILRKRLGEEEYLRWEDLDLVMNGGTVGDSQGTLRSVA